MISYPEKAASNHVLYCVKDNDGPKTYLQHRPPTNHHAKNVPGAFLYKCWPDVLWGFHARSWPQDNCRCYIWIDMSGLMPSLA